MVPSPRYRVRPWSRKGTTASAARERPAIISVDDVNEQEAHRAERDGAVHRLGDDPAARGHDDAVGREQADAYRRGEPNKGEDPA